MAVKWYINNKIDSVDKEYSITPNDEQLRGVINDKISESIKGIYNGESIRYLDTIIILMTIKYKLILVILPYNNNT